MRRVLYLSSTLPIHVFSSNNNTMMNLISQNLKRPVCISED